MTRLLWCGLFTAIVAGCDWDFERMQVQPHLRSYEPTSLFADGTAMRQPPTGTVAWTGDARADRKRGGVEGAGVEGAGVNRRAPRPRLDRALLQRGRDRFDRFCAACHGLRGDGQTPVAARMRQRPPPSLVSGRVRALSSRRVHDVIERGYGLMPSYAGRLTPRDRWAVVEYVQTLRLSQRVQLSSLPRPIQQEARAWLP